MPSWLSQRNFAVLALIAALTAIGVGYLGSVWAPFDILSHMRTHFAGAALVAALAIAWSRYGAVVLAGGTLTVLLAHSVVAWAQQDSDTLSSLMTLTAMKPATANAATDPTSSLQPPRLLKVVSYNTWHSNKELGKFERRIAKSDADIVVLVEFGPSKRAMLPRLAKTFPHQAQCSDYWYCSVAILSKHPITAKRILRRTADRAPTVIATLKIDGRPLTVVGTHLMRPIDGPRRQKREIASLSRLLHSIEGDMIVAGDFNATRWSSALTTLVKRTSLKTSSHFLPSWPRSFPQLAIDHIFSRGQAHVAKMKLAKTGTADHIAVVGEVELR